MDAIEPCQNWKGGMRTMQESSHTAQRKKKKKKGRTRKVKHHGQHSGKAEGLRFLAMCFFMCLHRLYDSKRRVKRGKKKRLTFVLPPFYPLLSNNSTHDVSMSGLFALRYFQHVSTLINSCKVRLRVPAAVNLPQFATCTHLYEQKKKKTREHFVFSTKGEEPPTDSPSLLTWHSL